MPEQKGLDESHEKAQIKCCEEEHQVFSAAKSLESDPQTNSLLRSFFTFAEFKLCSYEKSSGHQSRECVKTRNKIDNFNFSVLVTFVSSLERSTNY